MDVHAPNACASYELDWRVESGEPVAEGTVLAWLCGVGQCALSPLPAPCAGVVWRRTSLLPTALAGALLAVVDGDPSALRAEQARLIELRRLEVMVDLAALASRRDSTGLARALLAEDERRLRAWLSDAGALAAQR